MGNPERRSPFRDTWRSKPFKVTEPGTERHAPIHLMHRCRLPVRDNLASLPGMGPVHTHTHYPGWPLKAHTGLTLRMRPLRVPAKTTVRPW